MEPSVHLEAVLTVFEVDFEVLERLSWAGGIMLDTFAIRQLMSRETSGECAPFLDSLST